MHLFVIKKTGSVLNKTGLILNMTGGVLNITVVFLNMTGFVLNTTLLVLIIIYIIDLIDNLHTEGLIYVDDTTLIATGKDTYHTTTLLDEDLNKSRNGLLSGKSSLMLIN